VNVRICPPAAIFTLRGIRTKQSGAREVVPDFITCQYNICKIITFYKYIYVNDNKRHHYTADSFEPNNDMRANLVLITAK
jgi:hypothetical protein